MICLKFIIPQQRKLMGSSAQTGSGVCRCGWQAQVPEGSGAGPGAGCRRRFQKVPEGSGGFRCRAGSGCMCRFQKVPEGFGRFRKVPEGSGRFRKVPVQGQVQIAGAGSGRSRRVVEVPVQGQVQVAGAGPRRFRKVPEKGRLRCRATSGSTRF